MNPNTDLSWPHLHLINPGPCIPCITSEIDDILVGDTERMRMLDFGTK